MTCFGPDIALDNLHAALDEQGHTLVAAGRWFAIKSSDWRHLRITAVSSPSDVDKPRPYVVFAHCDASGAITITRLEAVAGAAAAVRMTRDKSIEWHEAGDSYRRPKGDRRSHEAAERGNPLRANLDEQLAAWASTRRAIVEKQLLVAAEQNRADSDALWLAEALAQGMTPASYALSV